MIADIIINLNLLRRASTFSR